MLSNHVLCQRVHASGRRVALVFAALAGIGSLQGQYSDFSQLKATVAAEPPANSASTAGGASSQQVFYAHDGPWGKLRCFYFFLEAPKVMVDTFPLPNTRPRWSFPEAALPQLQQFFASAGLSGSFIQELLSPANLVKESGMVHVFPPLADLEAIQPEARSVIYKELAKYPINEFHVDPVLILTDTVEEWYATSRLRPELVAKIKQLSYHRGETIAFSDLSALLNYAQSDAEARQIFKAFTRTRAMMVKLELDRNTNLEELLGYWTLGQGVRRKDIEPLIQSILDTNGADRLDVVHVMPALPRKLLYTYPGMDLARHGLLPDCHWTSLNYFNYEPQEYLLDSRLATSSVLENFTPVEPPYRYGDILFFLDNDKGNAFHSCVYLADNIVYTKNGRNPLSPWILMTLDDVRKVYLFENNGRVQGYRKAKPSDDS